MFTRLKNALSGPDLDHSAKQSGSKEATKYPYCRPHFLQLNEDEIQASIDHRLRPIISPSNKLANFSGYAECINGGKSRYNEDQAVTHQAVLASGSVKIPYKYFALFDGHAGVGAAICAANQLHHVLHQRLVDAQDDLWSEFLEDEDSPTRHELIIGALEMAFTTMDDIIKEELVRKQSNGGCTALVAISILGYLYVANAGDSRAIVCSGSDFKPLSNDFTPETEKQRIRQLAQLKPHLLGKEFTFIEYVRQPKMKDLGKRVLFKDSFMKGWSYKTIVHDDLKCSIITGQGKRSRVMGTIGVTRGFGDHELLSVYQKIPIKPFLSCHPEVQIFDLKSTKEEDVLVMGTDGLWDVLDGESVSKIITDSMGIFAGRELYVSAATCLVGAARGTLKEHQWMMKNGKCASVDDISVFVVPLYPMAGEHAKMKENLNLPLFKTRKGDDEEDKSLQENKKLENNCSWEEYVSTVLQEIRNKQTKEDFNSNKFNNLCIVSTSVSNDKTNNQLNLNISGKLPSRNDNFLLVNVNAVESLDVVDKINIDLQSENNLECPKHSNKFSIGSSVQFKRLENVALDSFLEVLLLEKPNHSNKFRLRTRSYPGIELKGTTYQKTQNKLESDSKFGNKESLLYRIKLKNRDNHSESECIQRDNI